MKSSCWRLTFYSALSFYFFGLQGATLKMIACRALRVRSLLLSRSLLSPRQALHVSQRSFVVSSSPKTQATPRTKAAAPDATDSSKPLTSAPVTDSTIFYQGPLARTFHSLKVFSLSSLTLCVTTVPFIYVIDASLATSARTAIVAFAIATSSLSTGLVNWFASPYVQYMRRLPQRVGAVEIVTKNILLQDRMTRVYDPMFLGPTKRHFAKWELVGEIAAEVSNDASPERRPGGTEVAAETFDKQGNLLGRWLIKWSQQPSTMGSDPILIGVASSEGKPVR